MPVQMIELEEVMMLEVSDAALEAAVTLTMHSQGLCEGPAWTNPASFCQ